MATVGATDGRAQPVGPIRMAQWLAVTRRALPVGRNRWRGHDRRTAMVGDRTQPAWTASASPDGTLRLAAVVPAGGAIPPPLPPKLKLVGIFLIRGKNGT